MPSSDESSQHVSPGVKRESEGDIIRLTPTLSPTSNGRESLPPMGSIEPHEESLVTRKIIEQQTKYVSIEVQTDGCSCQLCLEASRRDEFISNGLLTQSDDVVSPEASPEPVASSRPPPAVTKIGPPRRAKQRRIAAPGEQVPQRGETPPSPSVVAATRAYSSPELPRLSAKGKEVVRGEMRAPHREVTPNDDQEPIEEVAERPRSPAAEELDAIEDDDGYSAAQEPKGR
jgi:hypothetical protein